VQVLPPEISKCGQDFVWNFLVSRYPYLEVDQLPCFFRDRIQGGIQSNYLLTENFDSVEQFFIWGEAVGRQPEYNEHEDSGFT